MIAQAASRNDRFIAIVAGCGAADTLGLPLGQVRVLHGSTPFLDEGYGAFASRT